MRHSLPPTLFDTTEPRVSITHNGRRWGVVVEHGFLVYGLTFDGGAVFPIRRWTRRGIRRAAHRLLRSYRHAHPRQTTR